MIRPGADLHHLLQRCRGEAETLSNALGLSLLLPKKSGDVQDFLGCLHDLGTDDLAGRAVERMKELCSPQRQSFQSLLQSLRAVGEVVAMQSTSEEQATLDLASRIARDLPNVLGPAGMLFRLAADPETEWNIEYFLNMELQEKAWQASVFAHIICFLGAAESCVNQIRADLPPAIKPFAMFNTLDEPTLESTFWPGVPDDWWQALRYSGIHKHLLPVTGNIVWAQCRCGYRYCFAQCGAPTSEAPCASPEGERLCTLANGGRSHAFAQGQGLVAVVVTAPPHGDGWPPVYSTMRQQFPPAFQVPAPAPGLFALTEADLMTSVTEADRSAVSHSLMSETVRQNWNAPLGKPPDPNSGLHPVSFRVLHLLVHASALVRIEMEWVQECESTVQLLQGHLRDVARMNPVRTASDTAWYFMANVEADLEALAKLLNGTVEVATLFVHAVLHRIGSLGPMEQPNQQSLTSHAARVVYETWFHHNVTQPILGEKGGTGDYSRPGVDRLRREAGQETDQDLVLTCDLLARRGLQADAWASMEKGVRAALLPHVLQPLMSPTIEGTFEELLAASEGGSRFALLRLVMAGLDADRNSWHVVADLERAASLAWILPFLQFVRDKEGGKITRAEARTTTIRDWLLRRVDHEKAQAWMLFRNFEAAWNATLAADNLRDGCGVIRLPEVNLDSPVALLCPMADPDKPQHGDIPVGNRGDKPEHIVALGLHHLAVSHNKLVAQIHRYLDPMSTNSAHVRARLHTSAGLCRLGGRCHSVDAPDQRVRLIQHAVASDFFVFPSQLDNTCSVRDGADPDGPRSFRLDYKIDSLCKDFFQVPWSADPPARGKHDLEAMENDLAWRLIAGRRPLQICSDMGENQDSLGILLFQFT